MAVGNGTHVRDDKLPRTDLTIEAFAAALLSRLSDGAAAPNWLGMNALARQEALTSMREMHAQWVAGELAAAERRALIRNSAQPWTPQRQTSHIRSSHPD